MEVSIHKKQNDKRCSAGPGLAELTGISVKLTDNIDIA
jgi:hypothetical protein